MRGLIDRKGEQFAYLDGLTLYTIDGEPTGYVQNGFVVDLAGNKVWRIIGDGIYSLNGAETIGYFSANAALHLTI